MHHFFYSLSVVHRLYWCATVEFAVILVSLSGLDPDSPVKRIVSGHPKKGLKAVSLFVVDVPEPQITLCCFRSLF
jgi:hypothetical protein